ncbi:hypothetical protein ACE1TH_11470 [Shouchella sp. JSM 1781072]|uniref:hypothetical protein n=1 Tax=Shouchella sp. JSM 1781072 TaxID=3344581 RepID=UPI0035C188E5
MAITLPVSGVGTVTILLTEGEVLTFNCPNSFNPPPQQTINVAPGTLYRVSCGPAGTLGGASVTYIPNFNEIDFIELFALIQGLPVDARQGALVNTFIATSNA